MQSQHSTWSAGRTTTTKKRNTIGPETFRPASSASATDNGSIVSNIGAFQRNSSLRGGSLYDRNGRRIGAGNAKSTSTSPTKALSPTPLVQQIQDAARTAKSDAQMLQKMKQLLTQYTNKSDIASIAAGAEGSTTAAAAALCDDDFTTAWVNSNGGTTTLNDRQRIGVRRCSTGSAASSCGSASSPVKITTSAAAAHSKRSSSAASSVDSLPPTSSCVGGACSGPVSLPIALAPRPQRGASRIPAPIRQNTVMY